MHDGITQPTAFILTVTPTCNITGYYNYEPVVSYTSLQWSGTLGDYVVAWVHGPSFADCTNGITNTIEKDIVAKTYNQGVQKAGQTCYSIINRNTCSTNNQKGDQVIPSIAGRALTNGINGKMGFCFYDKLLTSHYYIAHKTTTPSVFPGNCGFGLKQLPPVSITDKNKISISAVPNPFSNTTNFKISMGDYETGTILIYDASGKQLQQVKVTSNKMEYEFKSEATMKPGVYFAKLITNNGEATAQTKFEKLK
jgi:hypothetical protein